MRLRGEDPTNFRGFQPVEKKETSAFAIRTAYDTWNGERHPDWNEDRVFADPKGRCMIVVDGVGDTASPELAAHNAANEIFGYLQNAKDELPAAVAEDIMRRAFQDARKALNQNTQDTFCLARRTLKER